MTKEEVKEWYKTLSIEDKADVLNILTFVEDVYVYGYHGDISNLINSEFYVDEKEIIQILEMNDDGYNDLPENEFNQRWKEKKTREKIIAIKTDIGWG